MATVEIFSSAHCPYCVRAKALLQRKGVKIIEKRIDLDAALLAEMQQRSNNARTVPQIFIGDVHVGGCDDLYQLEQQGKLDRLLGA